MPRSIKASPRKTIAMQKRILSLWNNRQEEGGFTRFFTLHLRKSSGRGTHDSRSVAVHAATSRAFSLFRAESGFTAIGPGSQTQCLKASLSFESSPCFASLPPH